jgi:hypothetical protein
LHPTGQIHSSFEIDALDQHGDGNFLTALDLLGPGASTLGTLEAVELRCVLFEVLGRPDCR